MTGSTDFSLNTCLREAGALQEGHFLLASGRHSGQYVEKFALFRQPCLVEGVCAALIARLPWREAIEVVVGPTTGGMLLAYEVARQLKISAAYAEREHEGAARRVFRRSTTFSPGTKVLVVDDILTTGGSIRETLAALHPYNVTVLGVAVLVDRSTTPVELNVPFIALERLNIPSWEPVACPLCRQGVPLIKPGTSAPVKT